MTEQADQTQLLPEVDMEFQCRCCGHPVCSETFKVRECDLGIGSWHWYGRCESCKAISILQIPDDLFRYYGGGDYYSLQNSDAGSAVGTGWKANLLRKAYFGRGPIWSLVANAIRANVNYKHLHSTLQVTRLAELPYGARVLDVGCGAKTAFDQLNGLGFSAIDGCDPFIKNSVNRDYGTIFQSQIHDLKPTQKYNLVLFSHSLEHTEDPVAQLTAATQLLNETGRIAVLIPMGDCAEISRYGACSTLFEAPRHLFLPSRQSMNRLIDECNLSIVATRWHQSANTLLRSEYISQQPATERINFSQISAGLETLMPPNKVEEIKQLQANWHNSAKNAAVGLYILTPNPKR
ncbi:MAG: class I SAM-dependent methyltransferase [Kordiimonadaceae bacterium]|nr:class I SAM-dependent methyltransferase [Kordiimonadaceae bacterium]MBO6567099.1 class I SAM-dependent methyltransferase [Kordiimonadaceae bacterium]MBO6963686.1 class I SAM-dependent methyltransferase [Kordiimonadaceae bacterium]